jgi:hypothetical protein
MTEVHQSGAARTPEAPRKAPGPRFQPVDWVAWSTVAAMLLVAAAFALR